MKFLPGSKVTSVKQLPSFPSLQQKTGIDKHFREHEGGRESTGCVFYPPASPKECRRAGPHPCLQQAIPNIPSLLPTERCGMEGILRTKHFHPLPQGRLPLSQVAPSPAPPGLERFPGQTRRDWATLLKPTLSPWQTHPGVRISGNSSWRNRAGPEHLKSGC